MLLFAHAGKAYCYSSKKAIQLIYLSAINQIITCFQYYPLAFPTMSCTVLLLSQSFLLSTQVHYR